MNTAPRPWWRRQAVIVLGVLLLLAAIPVGVFRYLVHTAERELAAAIAETDALDPDWRLDDLLAKRDAIPDAENSSFVIAAAQRAMPKDHLAKPIFNELSELRDYPPALLTAKQAAALGEELRSIAPALAEARKLSGFPRGRVQIDYTPDYFSTDLKVVHDTRQIAWLLVLDATLANQQGAALAAAQSIKASFHAGRALRGEPSLIVTLSEFAIQQIALESLEQTLARGPLPENMLTDMQQLLSEEMAQPLLWHGMRGERAGHHRLVSFLQDGDLTDRNVSRLIREHGESQSLLAAFVDRSISFKQVLATNLRFLNEAVAISKLPAEQQQLGWMRLAASADPAKARRFLPDLAKVAPAYLRIQAKLRCAHAAMAVERYRLKNDGRWPNALADAVGEVPLDPHDGKPLRYGQTKDGVVIFSVGGEGNYNGTALENGPAPATMTYRPEFRLWNADRRRQPPLAEKDPEDGEQR